MCIFMAQAGSFWPSQLATWNKGKGRHLFYFLVERHSESESDKNETEMSSGNLVFTEVHRYISLP